MNLKFLIKKYNIEQQKLSFLLFQANDGAVAVVVMRLVCLFWT